MRVEASGLPTAYVSSFMMTLVGQAPLDGPDMGGLSDLGFPSISQAVELADARGAPGACVPAGRRRDGQGAGRFLTGHD